MLDKRKIRLMTRAAIYEKRHGEEDLKVSGYYKKDYTSLNTWITIIWITVGYALSGGVLFLCYGDALLEGITIIWITVGYALSGGVLFLCYGDALLEGITIMRLFLYAAVALGAYLVLVIIYGIGAGNFYSKKHARAKQRVKRYMRDISRLEKMNNKKEKNRS